MQSTVEPEILLGITWQIYSLDKLEKFIRLTDVNMVVISFVLFHCILHFFVY